MAPAGPTTGENGTKQEAEQDFLQTGIKQEGKN
jgi:hypothetical protein